VLGILGVSHKFKVLKKNQVAKKSKRVTKAS
jgi:hypothetical protein